MPDGHVKVSNPIPDGTQAGSVSAHVSTPTAWQERCRGLLQCLLQDVDAVLRHDPAARTRLEVVVAYPGLHALWLHRWAHRRWKKQRQLSARCISAFNRFFTGIEIHPGAHIGRGVFIDHGMGVVIGETAKVGDGCILYKGVVLGGTQTERVCRHPQLGARVVVGSNACILGHITVGDGARIGSGSVVIRPVPSGATVVGVPGRIVPTKGDRRARFNAALDHANLPDPTAEMLRTLRHENERLRQRLERLETHLHLPLALGDDSDDDPLIDGALSTSDLPPQHGG
ncbi:MAG: serine O-acetyltransferase [Polyangiales bacterium]